MDAAFHFVEPSPAPSAFVFSLRRLPSAGPASDGAITLVVERIVGDGILLEIIPDRFVRPVGHRIEFYDFTTASLIKRVNLDDSDVGSGL